MPKSVDFGDLIEGTKYAMMVPLKNTGLSKMRFKARVPTDAGVSINYKIGPVAPGLMVKLDIQFTAGGGVLREDGIFGELNKIHGL